MCARTNSVHTLPDLQRPGAAKVDWPELLLAGIDFQNGHVLVRIVSHHLGAASTQAASSHTPTDRAQAENAIPAHAVWRSLVRGSRLGGECASALTLASYVTWSLSVTLTSAAPLTTWRLVTM